MLFGQCCLVFFVVYFFPFYIIINYLQTQIEPAVDTKFQQYLREIELTLEAILISISGDSALSKDPNDGVLFSSLFDAFWVGVFLKIN